MNPVIILGTGLAGYALAKEIRKLHASLPLQLISADDSRVYSKPMLSNALARDKSADELASASATQMAAQLNASIDVHTRVSSIDRAGKTVDSEGGRFPYSRLILALGAEPVRLALEGNAAGELMSVNNLSDYARFRERLAYSRRVLILGAGLIGCEFANDLASAGFNVSVVDPGKMPLQALVPRYCAERLEAALGEQGVAWHFGTTAQTIDKSAHGLRVTLANGEHIDTDLILSAVGLRPCTQLASEAGVQCNRGIQVDRYLASSDNGIFALGDCAEVSGLVLPFVMPIMYAARALAKTLAGKRTVVEYPAMPVIVKTPSMPLVAAPPPRDSTGEWRITKLDSGTVARFEDCAGRLLGFALSGNAVSQKQSLTAMLPPLLA